MSFGMRRSGLGYNQHELIDIIDTIKKAVRYAASQHVLMFAAASNNGINESRAFPATIKQYVIGVHASDGNGNDGGFNPEPLYNDYNFQTLGVALKVPRIRANDWVKITGTSFATAVAVGIAAVMLDIGDRPQIMTELTRKRLKTCEGMKEMFHLMSKSHRTNGRYHHVAPWLLWKYNLRTVEGWERIRQEIHDAFVEISEGNDFSE
jgi:subtilisin family serine protease